MNKTLKTRQQRRMRRKARVRARISGTAARPRLNVFRSLRGMFLQLIDDATGKTLLSINAKMDVSGVDAGERTGKMAQAYALGKLLAEQAKEKNINTVVFDRAGFLYHGRVKAAADGARDGGLKF
ncbi:MAG: 50S ribosomal protein L18 [Candidatus Magasanikbacteria bacterium]|jgi:large subunit ribosomal protein L18|nr:50S ribosomal protein L18 [Candidatus Magasanikbacteria bacterium]MBT4220801.1 50S ribosomal protein L18 [Candidatus Magasanikbacteria bacterium]MBT4350146.1 50S ribosomal protein L18 [Candidatus Magasanikbacteria bacterium]MBT4541411.1 50S ribosomal protein L18 [Candidatus Magasanikbacteria bacterium]MBT6253149.1 50S ribosomal protein L18 [Candidatus Magasanikbacteria bacterium]